MKLTPANSYKKEGFFRQRDLTRCEISETLCHLTHIKYYKKKNTQLLTPLHTMIFSLLLLIAGAHSATLRSADTNYPVWPVDFKWSYGGVPANYNCIQIIEEADPHTWADNYFCWKNERQDPGFKWSSAGPVSGMRCTQILEPSDPHTWADNYLCVKSDSAYDFVWSMRGQVQDKSCIQWTEPSDPDTWADNFLCATAGVADGHIAKRSIATTSNLTKRSIPGVSDPEQLQWYHNLPVWPMDFKWSSSGIPANHNCVKITESSEPAEHTWGDNFFCWNKERSDPGFKWSSAGPISGMRCTQIIEPSDPHTWTDNYLCVKSDTPFAFTWSSGGPITGKKCVQWSEPSDPDTWSDNWLCAPGGGISKRAVVNFPDPVFPDDFK